MLEIRHLNAGYPGKTVLSDLCLTLREGTVTAILGPNGCGKSTLLKALAGILPSEGSMTLGDLDLRAISGKERAKKIAFLPQSRTVPEITVKKLVLHGRFPYLSYPRRYRQEDLDMAQKAMERMGIADLAHRELTTLSGGQRQKIYIAMALAQDTPVVLLDEPNSFLDIAHQFQLMELAGALAAEGKIVVTVLHDLAMALEWADSLVVVQEGRCLYQGTGEETFLSGSLEEAFHVKLHRISTPEGWKYYCGKQFP